MVFDDYIIMPYIFIWWIVCVIIKLVSNFYTLQSLRVQVLFLGWFLHVTDFHWDYTYGTQDWSCNDEVTNHGLFGDYWCDSPWNLITSAVEAMKNATEGRDADFVLWTG